MEIIFANSEVEVMASRECRILNKYIDYSSKFLIVEELDLVKEIVIYYVVNSVEKRLINIDERAIYFNYNLVDYKCKNDSLTIVSKRDLNKNTGKETICEKLIDSNNIVLLERIKIAFSERAICSLEEEYNRNKLEKEKERLFWIDNYPNYSIDNKVKYWVTNIHHGMRMQGEATNDPYSEFSEEWYKYVKSKEDDFDFIFGEVVPRLGIDFNWDEYHKRIKKSI